MLTKAGINYYLECALTLDEAKKNIYEDMEAYSVKLYPSEELKDVIKNDIIKYIVQCLLSYRVFNGRDNDNEIYLL